MSKRSKLLTKAVEVLVEAQGMGGADLGMLAALLAAHRALNASLKEDRESKAVAQGRTLVNATGFVKDLVSLGVSGDV